MSTTPLAQSLVRDQFETIFFSQVNFIKATLPRFREQHLGHIIVLTNIGGHLGTPTMSFYDAAIWALEGYCDSLAYEVAPFNIKVTIVQPNKEIQTLTSHLTFVPQIPAYEHSFEHAPSVRDMLTHVLNSHPDTVMPSPLPVEDVDESMSDDDPPRLDPDKGRGEMIHRYPKLPPEALDALVNETVHALTSIAGHENPPSRHIVGAEGATAVREKLKTVTEEMEDFVEASLAVDIADSEPHGEIHEEGS